MNVSITELDNRTSEINDLISLGDIQAANRLAIALIQGISFKNDTKEESKAENEEKGKVKYRIWFPFWFSDLVGRGLDRKGVTKRASFAFTINKNIDPEC